MTGQETGSYGLVVGRVSSKDSKNFFYCNRYPKFSGWSPSMHIRLECRPTNIRCCSQSKKKEHQNFFSRVSSRIPSENRFLQNLTSWGMVITFLYCFTVSDAIIVTEVEIFSRLILIFSSDIPGSSVTMRRNFPSSKRVAIGSIDFIGMVFSELSFSVVPFSFHF